jgi:hypothetical protein
VVFELVEEQHQVVNLSFAPLVATAGGEIHRDAAPPEVKASALPAPTHASWELAAVGGAPSAFATASVFAMGLGGAGLLTGGITFAVALAKLEDCPGHKCKTEGDAVGYETLKTVSTVSFYAGAALAAGGLVLWLTKPAETRPSPSEVTWTVGPGSVSVQVGF